MKIQVKFKKVVKHIASNLSDRLLSNTGKYSVSQLLKQRCSNSCYAIYSRVFQLGVEISRHSDKGKFIHAIIMDPPTVQAVSPIAAKSTFIESTMLLK